MARHFKQPAEPQDGDRIGPRQDQQPAAQRQTYRPPRASADAPRPSAQGAPTTSVGYVSIMSESEDGRDARGHRRSSAKRNNRRREKHYRETDPYDISGRRSRNPWKMAGRVLSTLLFLVGMGLIVYAAYTYLYAQYEYYLTDENNDALAEYATVSDNPSTMPSVDWESLKAVNDEVVGWIYIPGTVVNFPVYQADDNSYYLHTDAEGNYSVGGQIFMDYENTAPGLVDLQTVIYGHHLRNGAMFKVIADMESQEAFDAVTTVWYATETATYKLTPLLVYTTDEDDTTVRTFTFESTEEYQSYLSGLLAKASASADDAEELIATGAAALSLCTCNYDEEYDDGEGRTILVCIVTEVTSTSTDAEEAATDATEDGSADETTADTTDADAETDADDSAATSDDVDAA